MPYMRPRRSLRDLRAAVRRAAATRLSTDRPTFAWHALRQRAVGLLGRLRARWRAPALRRQRPQPRQRLRRPSWLPPRESRGHERPARRAATSRAGHVLVGLDELLATGTANRPVRSRSGHRSVRWQRVALAAVLAVGFALVLLMSGLLVVLPAPETGAPAVAELGMPEQVGEINSRAERAAAAVSDAATSMVAA